MKSVLGARSAAIRIEPSDCSLFCMYVNVAPAGDTSLSVREREIHSISIKANKAKIVWQSRFVMLRTGLLSWKPVQIKIVLQRLWKDDWI